jgi:hypothetical protein
VKYLTPLKTFVAIVEKSKFGNLSETFVTLVAVDSTNAYHRALIRF